MENYWPAIVEKPTGDKATDELAVAIENIFKIVFSRTLKSVSWNNAKLVTRDIEKEILELKEQPGKDILVGSPGLIAAAMQLDLVDEYQLCVHPVIAGGGLPLFRNMRGSTILKLLKT